MAGAGEKTHDATPQRREEARKEGRFARSRDLAPLAASFAVMAALSTGEKQIEAAVRSLFASSHGDLDAITRGEGGHALAMGVTTLFFLAGPSILVAAIAGTAAGAAQAGLRFDTDPFAWDFGKLNPLPRLAQTFSPKRGAFEILIAGVRVSAVAYVSWSALRTDLPGLLVLHELGAGEALSRVTGVIAHVTTRVLAMLALIAAVDYIHSRKSLADDMKMSDQEVKEEGRSQEGDPKVKGRIRARARALARKRMMGSVKGADVVVTNPTHVAVALRYGPKDAAPVVVAKGHDEVALAIRAQARKHGIPILENRVLARALDAEVDVGHPIPGAHFGAVAQVLAFVYRLRARRGPSKTAR